MSLWIRIVSIALFLIAPAACSDQVATPGGEVVEVSAETSPSDAGGAGSNLDEDNNTIYALGFTLSRNLGSFALTESEVETLSRGIRDGVLDREPEVDVDAYRAKIQTFQQARLQTAAEREKKDSQAFLEQMAKEEGAVQTESGLIYIEQAPGEGASPAATDTVRVHYHGTLRDGSVFDSSVDRGQPATFPLNRVIPCWTEAVQRMKPGGSAKIICPSKIAYGDTGAPPRIAPGAALSFDVELIEIVAAEE